MQNGVQQGGSLRRGLLVWLAFAAVFGAFVYLRVTAPKGAEVEVSAAVEQLRLSLLAASRASTELEQNRKLGDLVLPEAQLRVAGRLFEMRGRSGMLRWLLELQVNSITLEIKSQELALSQDGTQARAFLEVLATGKNAGGTRIEARRVQLRFVKRALGWKLADMEVFPEARNYPEARP